MQLTNTPGKLVLPFANAGAKNTIPTASQIGITAGAASLTDGFPPLTRTPIAAGGVPPSGLDMNGILYEMSAIIRWANAGGGYAYDAAFATDPNVGGYPKGARVLRSDGLGYWFNTTDNNITDPEGVGAVAAGWVPDFTNGVAAVTMTGSNVTLTALQYGKPIIVISGLLTANLNLIFPSIAGEWSVINNTTGAYSVTCKTAAGTGVVVNSAQAIVGNGTNIYSAVNDAISSMGELIASAGGTADVLTATFAPAPRKWPNGVPFLVRAASANATTTPTFTANSGTLAAKTIVKGADAALAAGDIAGAGHWLLMQYDVTLDKVVLLNPAKGIAPVSASKQLQPITVTQASNILTGTFAANTLDYRNATAAAGTPNAAVANGALTLAIPATSNLGMLLSTGVNRLVWAVAYNAGTPVLCVANIAGGLPMDETGFISPTTIGASSNSASTWYSASAVAANSPYRIVGFSDVVFTTGTGWSTPSLVQPIGGQALAALSSIGYGQTWQTFTPGTTRIVGTTYYNTTGKPIFVSANGQSAGGAWNFGWTVNGVVVGNGGMALNNSAFTTQTAIIPPGASYVLTQSGTLITGWQELR